MRQAILTIFTRTPLHVGAGSSVGAIDQPVIRERHTRFPVIPGSSIKGVLADLWPERVQATDSDGKLRMREGQPVMIRTGEGRLLFGSDDERNAEAGKLLVGEGRLLAFPVRSAKGCFAWLTCPLALRRFQRGGGDIPKSEISDLKLTEEDVCLTSDSAVAIDGRAIFEEYPLTVKGMIGKTLVDALIAVCGDTVWQDLPKRLAVVSDELFAYFADNACEVAQHIRIDDAKGTVAKGALFNQENVPSETLFYAPMQSTEQYVLVALEARLKDGGDLLQLGADATTGLGWCSVKLNSCK